MVRARCLLLILSVSVIVAASATDAVAQRAARVLPPGLGPVANAAGSINLPYLVQDSRGGQWRIYQGGWMQQQGHQPVYSQGAQLVINGQPPNMNNNLARLDDKTGELVMENLNAQGLIVTRRIFVDKEQALARYIDIIKNPGVQPVTAQVNITGTFNYQISTGQDVPDPKRKGQEIGWVGQTNGGPCIMEIFGGKGSKNSFQINGAAQTNTVQASISVTIPAGKEVAVMHMHGSVASAEAGLKFVREMKESQIMRAIPKELRKIIINFSSGQNYIGDAEILRGDTLDVVEIRGGDHYKGTLKEPSFALQSVYGKFDVPAEQVIGLINIGRYRPHYLVVTADGQIFGGKLAKESIDIELSSKQVVKVPLSQITRIGYRKREGEPEEWNFEKPIVLMRSGERVGVRAPTEPVTVFTRYGKLVIKPELIAALVLQAEEHGMHEVRLTDGSRFAGLIETPQFAMKLDNASGQDVTFPSSSVARMQFTNKLVELSDSIATLVLANDDLLVGTLTGQLSIETAFDTIKVNAEEIKSLTHPTAGLPDVSITLWDGSALSGLLQDQELSCNLASGLALKVPVMLVEEYQQPQPAPSAAMMNQIKLVVAELNAEDWKQRDRAEVTLIAMGPVAIGILKELRAGQPPEAQQRIDSIVKELDKQRASEKSSAPKPVKTIEALEIPLDIGLEN
jgi:hypothetical protein